MSSTDPEAGLVIRAMREIDTVRVHHIHTEYLMVSLKDYYTPRELEAWIYGRSPEGYWRFANDGETFRLAERDGEIVGFANWRGDELRSLFVSPQHQRRGIGSALFRSCDGENRIGFVKATLGAVAFYSRFSFAEVERGFDLKRGVALPHVAMRRRD